MINKYIRFFVQNYLFSIVCIAFLVIYWDSAHNLNMKAIRFPLLVTAVMIPVLLWNIVESVLEFKRKYDADKDNKEAWVVNVGFNKGIIATVIITLIYITIMKYVGYCVSTLVYTFVLSVALGNRSWVKCSIYSIVLTVVVYLIFGIWLHVRFPHGFLF